MDRTMTMRDTEESRKLLEGVKKVAIKKLEESEHFCLITVIKGSTHGESAVRSDNIPFMLTGLAKAFKALIAVMGNQPPTEDKDNEQEMG